MMRVEIEVSVAGRPNDVTALTAWIARALLDMDQRGTVVHRLTVEEADA